MTSDDDLGEDYPGELSQSTELMNVFDQENVTTIPSSDIPTGNETEFEWTPNHTRAYIAVCLLCVFLCTVAVIINIRILLCVKWIRRPLSPTIYISLSLAMADTCSAMLIALGLIFNSLLPKGLNIEINNDCLPLVIEAFRLSVILISTIHVLALAGNHYFGILCPFRSMTLLTPTNIKIVVFSIWFLPTAYIFAYFGSFENQGFQRRDCLIEESQDFLLFSRFRTIFSALFFIPMVIMFAIYIHISIIVKKHQANRKWFNRHSRRHEEMSITGSRNDQQKHLDRNLKAIWTSLLILSTYVICFMPVVIHFYLICKDCYFTFDAVDDNIIIALSSITNFLLIAKYLLNPLIYASRMQEIRLAVKQMDAEWRRRLCQFGSVDELERGGSSRVEGSQRFSLFSSSSKRQNIKLTSIQIKNGVDKNPKNTTEL